jgi:hypothetical protein
VINKMKGRERGIATIGESLGDNACMRALHCHVLALLLSLYSKRNNVKKLISPTIE